MRVCIDTRTKKETERNIEGRTIDILMCSDRIGSERHVKRTKDWSCKERACVVCMCEKKLYLLNVNRRMKIKKATTNSQANKNREKKKTDVERQTYSLSMSQIQVQYYYYFFNDRQPMLYWISATTFFMYIKIIRLYSVLNAYDHKYFSTFRLLKSIINTHTNSNLV